MTGSSESGFSLDRRTLIRRKVQRAEANNVLLSTQCSCRGARKSQQSPLTRSFHYERASPNGAATSSASQNRSLYAAAICSFTSVSFLKMTHKSNKLFHRSKILLICQLITVKNTHLFRAGQTFSWTDSHLRTLEKKKRC